MKFRPEKTTVDRNYHYSTSFPRPIGITYLIGMVAFWWTNHTAEQTMLWPVYAWKILNGG